MKSVCVSFTWTITQLEVPGDFVALKGQEIHGSCSCKAVNRPEQETALLLDTFSLNTELFILKCIFGKGVDLHPEWIGVFCGRVDSCERRVGPQRHS